MTGILRERGFKVVTSTKALPYRALRREAVQQRSIRRMTSKKHSGAKWSFRVFLADDERPCRRQERGVQTRLLGVGRNRPSLAFVS
jgi:hypothetical protein